MGNLYQGCNGNVLELERVANGFREVRERHPQMARGESTSANFSSRRDSVPY